MLLQDQLDEITTHTRTLVQADRLAMSERLIADLYASGIEDRILPVGATAPEFSLFDASNRLVHSRDLLAIGPLVLTFFRGRWCPYCITELEAWRGLYARVRESGALIAAVSPQTVRQNEFLSIQHALAFPVLSDPGCAVASRFGLTYTVSPSHQQYYRSILVNIPLVNGDQSWQLPLPATYVLDQDGKVLFAAAHADFRVRPEPLEALESLSGTNGPAHP